MAMCAMDIDGLSSGADRVGEVSEQAEMVNISIAYRMLPFDGTRRLIWHSQPACLLATGLLPLVIYGFCYLTVVGLKPPSPPIRLS
jgi:hypothetical protein